LFKFIATTTLLILVNQSCFGGTPPANDALTTTTVPPTHQLTPYSANYEVTWKSGWFPVTVKASRTLKKSEEFDWILLFEAYSSIADLSEISQFNVVDHVIQPQRYSYKTTGFLSKKRRQQEFNWTDKTVWLPRKEIFAGYELPENLQDNMSYQEQIRLELMAGKKEFEYPIAYKNRLKHYHFEVVQHTQLKTKQGNVNAIEVRQTHLTNKKESTHLWYATDYDFLLLQLVKVKSNGDKSTILLKSAQLPNQTLQGF
jgi:hypothetical protein